MAQHNIFCAYGEVATKLAPLGLPALGGGGIYTGHHLIPDHCFYVASGLRGMGDLGDLKIVPGYSTMQAPVLVVTADANGGKSREHKAVHDIFDPDERGHVLDKQWTYAQARKAAVDSVVGANLGVSKLDVEKALDDYFVVALMLDGDFLIRAGEHTAFPNYVSRKSPRSNAGTTAMKSAKHKPY